MSDRSQFDDLFSRLSESLPQGLHQLGQDVKKNLRASLETGLSKINLISREEFDLQAASLASAREELAQLSARLEALEAAQTKSTKRSTKSS